MLRTRLAPKRFFRDQDSDEIRRRVRRAEHGPIVEYRADAADDDDGARSRDQERQRDDALGLIPSWARMTKSACRRSTRALTRSARSPPFAAPGRPGRRCLIVTDGFYEWRKKGDKQPSRSRAQTISSP